MDGILTHGHDLVGRTGGEEGQKRGTTGRGLANIEAFFKLSKGGNPRSE